MLDIKNLCFSYRSKPIFHNLAMHIKTGEIVTLLGSSGSGKSTFFKLIAGMIKPKSGTIIPAEAHHVSYMTQEDLLLPWRTVFENLSLIYELGKKSTRPKEDHSALKKILEEINLTGYENYYPDQLSCGMRQRVSLAKSLLQKRSLLLLDEPFASLDVALKEQMYQLLRTINATHKTTIVLVTHDFHDALALSNRILLLSNGVISHEWNIAQDNKHQVISQLRQAFHNFH